MNVTLANLTPDKLYEIWIGGTKCGEFKAGEDGKANVSVPALNEPEIDIKGMKDVAKEPAVGIRHFPVTSRRAAPGRALMST